MTVPVLTLWVIVNLKAVHGNEVISAERAGCVERTGWGGRGMLKAVAMVAFV